MAAPRDERGCVPFQVGIGYRKAGEEHWYVSQCERRLFSRDTPPGMAVGTLVSGMPNTVGWAELLLMEPLWQVTPLSKAGE